MQGLEETCPTCKKQVYVVNEIRSLSPYVKKTYSCTHQYDSTKELSLRSRVLKIVREVKTKSEPWIKYVAGLLGVIILLKQLGVL